MRGAARLALEGRQLGDFVVRQQIGEGGFGAVFRAEQPQLGRQAVIKVLHGAQRPVGDGVDRFLREARLAARLDHPFAAHIYAFGVEPDGVRWIAMELVRGTPLDRLLAEEGPLPLERLVPLLERICEVLQAAHDQGIVHRDIKPANVMVSHVAGRWSPKLLDFGVAKLADDPRPADPAPPAPGALEPLGEELRFAVTLSATPDAGGSSEPAGRTHEGALIGSPLYMAPEQWHSPRDVNHRTDLYALGCLAYEALTGKSPCSGPTLLAIAAAHARAPVPPLPDGLPDELNSVLRRALAKRSADRYGSALEFAAAFRAGSGIAEREALPKLPDPIREAALSGAPEPLAQAVAAFEAAGNAHQARDALTLVVHVAARLVGVLALACRTCVGSGSASGDSEAVRQLLRRLAGQGLRDEEWVELARGLVLPFAARREAHPLPELVELLTTTAGEPAPCRFAPLLALAGRAASAPGRVHDLLGQAVPLLAELLQALEFLAAYPIGVVRGESAESWMGARHTHRATIRLEGAAVVAGQPVLFDRAGRAVVELWPLAQVKRPASGAPQELFLLEGPGRRGARLVALPQGFERQDEALWDWFGEQLLEIETPSGAARADEERPPYCGLSPFTVEDALLFVGREREAEAFANQLRVKPLLVLVGPSGAGKSSFLHAAVLPLLPPRWRAIALRPGPHPLQSLEAGLERAGVPTADLRAQLARDPGLLGSRLRAFAADHDLTVLLIIDQLEELLTLCAEPADRDLVALAVSQAVRDPADPVRVVATLRDDFLIRCQQLPGLRERLGLGLQLIATPGPEELERMVVEPARRAGYEFDDPELPGEMVREVAAQPGALPLLSFTAAKLWELRDRHFRTLGRKAYRALHGVGGALAQHAEATLEGMGGAQRALAREVFRHLVTSEGTRAVVSRRDLEQLVGGGPDAAAALEQLIAARLVTTSEGERGDHQVEIVHEALLAQWPRLVAWRREDAEGARLRDQLRAAARQWDERGRPGGLLWRDDALAEYRQWRTRHPGALTDVDEAFARASDAAQRRSTRRARGSIAASFLILAAGLGVLWNLNRVSNARLAQLYEEQGRQALLADEPERALPFLAEAYRGGRDGAALHYLIGRTAALLDTEVLALEGGAERDNWLALRADGARVATASAAGTATIWDLATGRALTTLRGHRGDVLAGLYTPDGSRLITGGSDRSVRLWDAESGRAIATLPERADLVWRLAVSPDGARLASSSRGATLADANDHCVRLWSVTDGHPQATLCGHGDEVQTIRFSPDGARLLSAARDGTARVWDVASGRELLALHHPAPVLDARFSPGGDRIVTAAEDRSARIWQSDDGHLLRSLDGHRFAVLSAEFSPDGRRVVTASDTARVWDAESGKLERPLEGHHGVVTLAQFSPDGRRVLTASGDGTARVWSADDGLPGAILAGHQIGVRAAFLPDGARLLTSSYDGRARLWDPARSERTVTFAGHTGWVGYVRYRADGAELYTAGEDGTLRTWDPDRGRELGRIEGQRNLAAAGFSPDGRLAAVGDGSVERILDRASGRTIATLSAHADIVLNAKFSPDGTQLVTASQDRTARIWDVARARTTALLTGHEREVTNAEFSPDGKTVATSSGDGTVRLWDATSGRELRRLAGHSRRVESVAFSRDGRRLVSAGADRTARVWDLATGESIATLEGHTAEVDAAVFSPDGGLVLTAGTEGTVKIWEAASGRLLRTIAAHAGWAIELACPPEGTRCTSVGQDGKGNAWSVALDRRSPAEVDALARCRSRFRLVEGRLAPRAVDRSACGG